MASQSPEGTACFAVSVSDATLTYIRDHIVGGRTLMPGTGFFECAMAAARNLAVDSDAALGTLGYKTLTLAGVTIASPLLLSLAGQGGKVLTVEVGTATGTLRIASADQYVSSSVHLSCFVTSAADATDAARDGALISVQSLSWRQALISSLSNESTGFELGHSIAQPTLPQLEMGESRSYCMHPAAADNALHLAAIVPLPKSSTKPSVSRVPVAVEGLVVPGLGACSPTPSSLTAAASHWAVSEMLTISKDCSSRNDVWLIGTSSNPSKGAVQVKGMTCKVIGAKV